MIDLFLSELLFFFILGIIILFAFFKATAVGKGIYGELLVKGKLKRCLKNKSIIFNNYICFNNDDSTLSNGEKMTVQIDHVVVCHAGVLVIETKNYSGRIYGSNAQWEWTQVLAGGKVKNKLYNPIKQNDKHCYHIKKILNDEYPVYSLVILIKNNTEYLNNDTNGIVIGFSQLKRYLKNLPNQLSESEIVEAAEILSQADQSQNVSSYRHRKNVIQKRNVANSGVCPRCGAPLVQKEGKYGTFWGCGNYPYCKFIKK